MGRSRSVSKKIKSVRFDSDVLSDMERISKVYFGGNFTAALSSACKNYINMVTLREENGKK